MSKRMFRISAKLNNNFAEENENFQFKDQKPTNKAITG